MSEDMLRAYAGLWIALTEKRTVGGVGSSAQDAIRAARIAWPKEHLHPVFVSEFPPHLLLPAWPLETLRALASEYPMWLVGGAVRDLLLGREPDDWDFTVQGDAISLARRVADRFSGDFYPLDAERGMGRAIVTPPYDSEPVDLDFAPIQGKDLEDDLRARDFSMNAMAMSLEGRLIDPHGGRADLERSQLSMVTPRALKHDPIRALRAVRLSNQFDLALTDETLRAVRRSVPALGSVPAERVQTEMIKLFKSSDSARGLQDLRQYGLLTPLVPEAASQPAALWQEIIAVVRTLDDLNLVIRDTRAAPPISQPAWLWRDLRRHLGPSLSVLADYLGEEVNSGLSRDCLLRWAALLYSSGYAFHLPLESPPEAEKRVSADLARERCRTLRLPNHATEVVVSVIRHHRSLSELEAAAESRRSLYRYFRETGSVGVAVVWFSLGRLLATVDRRIERNRWAAALEAIRRVLRAYFDRYDEVVAPDPVLDGHDLIRLGLEPGPDLGKVRDRLLELQAAGEINDRDEAVRYVQQYCFTSESRGMGAVDD